MEQRELSCLLVGWFLIFTISAYAVDDAEETTANLTLEENSITTTDSGWMHILDNFMGSQSTIKFCVVNSTRTFKKINRICPRLKSDPQSSIRCTVGNDRFNCLRQLMTDEADFTILEPEDLLVAVAYEEWPILVTHELRAYAEVKHSFAMTILANKKINYLWQMKKKGLCHPGIIDAKAPGWTKAFSKYLEEFSIVTECDPTKTLLENRMMGLSKYFDKACIAGPWSLNVSYDRELKLKYDNLCALCSNSESCYASDSHYGQEGALQCLISGVGDVAWVRLDYVEKHIKENPIDMNNYQFICPDGTSRKVDNPCVWITKPWPVVVAKRESAENVSEIISNAKARKSEWERILLELMEDYHPIPINTDNLEMPEDFLRQFPGFLSANNRASPCQPTRRIKWCVTTNLENSKCQRMRDVASAYGIQPPIACIQKPHINLCTEAIRSQRADILVVKPEELLAARKNGLKPIMRATSNKEQDLDRIVAVVKHDSLFETLMDLKNTRACFTGYRSFGWNAFVNFMNESMKYWDCSEAQAVGDFFKESCVFNLDDSDKSSLPSNLYSLCKRDEYRNETTILNGLNFDMCDVTFIKFKTLENNEDYIKNKYRILCMNDTSHDETYCWLAWTALAYVMGHENITDLRSQEIHSMLLEMNELFGVTSQDKTPAFTLYGDFEKNPNIIFPEKTQQLKRINQNDGNNKQRLNYENVVDNLAKKHLCNTASHFKGFNNLSYLYYFIIISILL